MFSDRFRARHRRARGRQVSNQATGGVREAQSDENGFYSFPNLLPAVYDLSVTAPGFKTAIRKGIELQVDQGLRIDVQLEVGEVRQTVEIAAEAPLLESESAKIGTVVETKQITELPLNGRQFAQLILLTPGALPIALGRYLPDPLDLRRTLQPRAFALSDAHRRTLPGRPSLGSWVVYGLGSQNQNLLGLSCSGRP